MTIMKCDRCGKEIDNNDSFEIYLSRNSEEPIDLCECCELSFKEWLDNKTAKKKPLMEKSDCNGKNL